MSNLIDSDSNIVILEEEEMDDQQTPIENMEQVQSWVQLGLSGTADYSTSTSRSHEEDVYEDLCYVTLRSSTSFVHSNGSSIRNAASETSSQQLLNHSSPSAVASTCLIDPHCMPIQNKRDYCMKELVETEKNYCEALSMIITNFMEPLSMVMIPEHVSQIFNQLKSLSMLHKQLYHQLSTSICTSQCFIQLRDRFVIYGEYCANLPKAQQLLDEICLEDEQVQNCVRECQSKVNQGRFKLRDLLSLPMQRILKYHLLLAELIRNTNDKHDDYHGLKRAYDVMLDIGAYINEVKRDTETLEIIGQVQRSIIDLSMPDNYELKDYGRLIKDGEVKMRCIDDQRMRLKNRYIFIFDKVILMCKTIRSNQYSYKEAIILDDYKLEEFPLCSPISKLAHFNNKSWTAGWCLVHRRTKQPTYTFYIKNEDAKRKWMEAIERAQENVRPKLALESDHQFTMATVSSGTSCASCDKLLKGTWFQGYQCFNCNVAVHRTCIASIKSCADILNHNNHNTNDNHRTTTTCATITASIPNQQQPPTPSRNKSRILVKANTVQTINNNNNHQNQTTFNGQTLLSFEPNDTIIVYSMVNGEQWFGRNIHTGQEGMFHSSMVTELVTDSPSASSSVDSPSTVATVTTRFSYDDQMIAAAQSTVDLSLTLPRKNHAEFGNLSSHLTTSTPLLSSMLTGNNERSPLSPTATANMITNHSNQHWNRTMAQDQGHLRLYMGNGYNLEEYSWFAGCMDRKTAQTTLQPLPNGSFLVRISPKQNNSYAISMNYKGQVEHMRVQVTYLEDIQPTDVLAEQNWSSQIPANITRPDRPTHFFLSERRYFRTIVDLVRWYSMNSLCESFQMVNTQLLLPYKKAYCHEVLGHAIALYAFTSTSSAASSFLSLRKGDRVTVVSRAAEDKGWWKGQINDRIGYFPYKYVTATTHSLKMSIQEQDGGDQQHNDSLNEKDLTPTTTAQQDNNDTSNIEDSSNNNNNNNSSATTLSSSSETGSDHSRQASSDAGIDMMNTTTSTSDCATNCAAVN